MLWFLSESVLMFSSKSFIVSGPTFRSLIYFEFMFLYGVRKCSGFILLHIVDQFSQHQLWKRLFSPLYVFASFIKDKVSKDVCIYLWTNFYTLFLIFKLNYFCNSHSWFINAFWISLRILRVDFKFFFYVLQHISFKSQSLDFITHSVKNLPAMWETWVQSLGW